MRRKPEQHLWDELNKHTKDLADWTRVETGSTGHGLPDLDGICKGVEFKLELKVCKKGRYSPIGLWRPTQIAWQTRRARLGGRVWNVVHLPLSSCIFLLHGRDLMSHLSKIATGEKFSDDRDGFRDALAKMII